MSSAPSDATLKSWKKVAFYSFLHLICRWLATFVFEMRALGREHFPETGGGLICSTHQSVMDPVLVGLICNRRLNYLARKTLFKNFLFRKLIEALDAIEIDRDRGGLMGLRETMARLKRGELVLIFPEGTRTHDGSIGTLKPGFIAVARRSDVPLIPVSIVGAYDVIPRRTTIPVRHPIAVTVGEPITAEQVRSMNDDQLMSLLDQRLKECDHQGRNSLDVKCFGESKLV